MSECSWVCVSLKSPNLEEVIGNCCHSSQQDSRWAPKIATHGKLWLTSKLQYWYFHGAYCLWGFVVTPKGRVTPSSVTHWAQDSQRSPASLSTMGMFHASLVSKHSSFFPPLLFCAPNSIPCRSLCFVRQTNLKSGAEEAAELCFIWTLRPVCDSALRGAAICR